MDATKHIELENALRANLGPERLKRMTEEISQIIRRNNLDCTPVILNDFFTYLKEVIHLGRLHVGLPENEINRLKDFATCDLVKELKTREAVSRVKVAPYENFSIEVEGQRVFKSAPAAGPAVLMAVWD